MARRIRRLSLLLRSHASLSLRPGSDFFYAFDQVRFREWSEIQTGAEDPAKIATRFGSRTIFLRRTRRVNRILAERLAVDPRFGRAYADAYADVYALAPRERPK
jgi:hypothetical protein